MTSRFNELRKKSGILTACFAGMMFGVAAIPFYTLGIFAGPVIEFTGWTMQQYQTSFTFIIVGTLAGPFIGSLCDRYGARPLALISTVAFALCLIAFPIAAQLGLYSFYVAWAVMALLGQGTGPITWTHIAATTFKQNRGLAFGIILAGSGVFAMVGPYIVDQVIGHFGWRAGYWALASAVLLVPLPLALIYLRPSETKKANLDSTAVQEGTELLVGYSLRQAIQDYRFHLIAVCFFIVGFGVAGLISNMVPMLAANGASREASSGLVGLIGFAVIVGRVLMGAALDRFWAPAVAAVTLLCPAMACFILLNEPPLFAMAVAILLVGFAAGAEFDIVAYLTTAYFGTAAYGKIYGILYAALFIGAAIAPPIFGSVFDTYESYRPILLVCLFAVPIAALALLSLGRYPNFDSEQSAR